MPKAVAIALHETFTRALAHIDESEGIADVGANILEALAGLFNCQWSTHWKVDATQMRLYPAAVWQATNVANDLLYRDTLRRQLSMSEGTAGHVWRSRKPVWTTNIIQDMCLPRSLEAVSADLHAGIWFAVKTDTAVYGVIEMLAQKLEPASEEILLIIERFGLSLGWLLETAHLRNMQQTEAI